MSDLGAIERARLSMMLDQLNSDKEFAHKLTDLAYYLDDETIQHIKAIAAEMTEAKSQLVSDSKSRHLTRDQQSYWDRALQAIRASKLATALDDPKVWKRASWLSEQASEFYYSVLSPEERRDFHEQPEAVWRGSDPANHVNEWDYTEWPVPILKVETGNSFPHPMNFAQRSVLDGMVGFRPPMPERKGPPDPQASKKLRALVRRLNDD